MAEEHRYLAAIMFTDIVGSAALSERNEPLYLELLSEHNQLLRSIFPRFSGKEIKMIGDSFQLEFASALDAARCALAIQKAIFERNRSAQPERTIRLRIGIHMGDVVAREKDLFGDTVNIAKRIESLAEPGGICVSEEIAHQIRNKIGAPLESLGTPVLKNIAQRIELFKLALPGQGPETGSGEQPVGAPPERKSIAVLPFVNMSPDPENEYFSDGITEEIINALTRIEGLKVTSRTSAFAFKGKREPLPKIGEQLGVSAVLEGSVRKAGNRVRVSAELVQVPEDSSLWSARYDREYKDIFSIQDEISEAIVSTLKVKLMARENGCRVRRATENLEAYNVYLQGRYFLARRSEESLCKAIEYFEKTLRIDDNNALAYSGLADSHCLLAEYGYRAPQTAAPKAEAAALRALAIDQSLAEAHLSLALIKAGFAWSWEEAEQSYLRSIELNSGAADSHYQYGFFLMHLGRFDEARLQLGRAWELDPLSLIVNRNIGLLEYYAGRYPEAERQLRKVEELYPDYVYTHLFLGWVYMHQGLNDRALEEFQKESQLFPKISTFAEAYLAWGYTLTGQHQAARDVLQHMERRSQSEYIRPYALALATLALGQVDQSLESLDRAFEERDPYLRFIKVDPTFDRLRRHERFRALLAKMGFANRDWAISK